MSIPELELEFNWLNPVRAELEFELELPSLELESELHYVELDSELRSTELKSDTKSLISLYSIQ